MHTQPYVPVEFADFSVYNASLESRERSSSKTDLSDPRATERAVSRSPTTSSLTSGYFSHSASNATLSDMAVPSSDSSDQLAISTKEAECSEHSGPSLAPDFRPASNQEPPEAERGLGKDKTIAVPLEENSALPKGSPSPQSIPEENSRMLCRTASCSELDAGPRKNGQLAREFCPGEVTVEHTTNVLEDHSFTEFMGVSDGKDFDGLTDCSVGEPSRRRGLTNETDHNSDPEGPPDAGQLHSKIEHSQVMIPRGSPCGFHVLGEHRLLDASPPELLGGRCGRCAGELHLISVISEIGPVQSKLIAVLPCLLRENGSALGIKAVP